MRNSLYWDDFERRANETVDNIRNNIEIPVRRVAVFVTNKCNFRCKYCNHDHNPNTMDETVFDNIVKQYGKSAIIHITGGEPSVVKWLYPYLIGHGSEYRFHLNTNAFITPPSEYVKRLKVSLDSCDEKYWNALVGRNAFTKVIKNINDSSEKTVVSITYTMTKENIRRIPEFIKFQQKEMPNIYALFFSIYKGKDKRFKFNKFDVDYFFNSIKPEMDLILDAESKALLNETITEKFRLIQGTRFPENKSKCCYLSLSERVFTPDGIMSGCSHLMRDNIMIEPGKKHHKCLYGCNRRLVAFNELVEEKLNV
jgi:MoaA/NifB/PqqE/SkfB family radical SAM enzyme